MSYVAIGATAEEWWRGLGGWRLGLESKPQHHTERHPSTTTSKPSLHDGTTRVSSRVTRRHICSARHRRRYRHQPGLKAFSFHLSGRAPQSLEAHHRPHPHIPSRPDISVKDNMRTLDSPETDLYRYFDTRSTGFPPAGGHLTCTEESSVGRSNQSQIPPILEKCATQ